ncbi:hypothetical protein HK102_006332 [Quaeritorhiza haematococci]|nr:hypothetical protein HK102_006332 [Quaeritorhiza haematococci]
MPWPQKDLTDLNRAKVDGTDPLADASTTVLFPGPVSVYFRNAMSSLADKILQADVVYGCAAWMTNVSILRALSKCKGVSIIVAKEDWMRPDSMDPGLKKLYSKLRPLEYHVREIPHSDIGNLNQCQGDVGDDPVRCCGNYNEQKVAAWPRMHHKFLVFAHYRKYKGDDGEHQWIVPYAVWTGSLNLTHNSENSLENGVYIDDRGLALAYSKEFGQVYAISEPLDWEHKWVCPEYRIGT